MKKGDKDKKFEEDFKILRDEVMALRNLIEFYRAIFNPKNEKIIKEEFPNFFATIQILITENVILRLARLMDPYEQGKRNKNLTLELLIKKHINKIQDNSSKEKLEELYKSINEKYKSSIKKLRDKRIAHFDYKKGRNIFEKIRITWTDIEDIVEKMMDIIDLFEASFGFKKVSYDQFKGLKEVEIDYLFRFILANKQILVELDDLRRYIPNEDRSNILNSIAEVLYKYFDKPLERIKHLRRFLLDKSYNGS